MNVLNRIKSNFFWGFVGETAGRGLMFILLVIYSRRLGPEFFGSFSFLQSVFMFAWISIDLGLGLFGTRSIARKKNDANEITSGILFTRTTLATFIAISSILVTMATQDENMVSIAAGFSIYLILRGAQTDWLLRGFEDYKYLCLILILSYLALFLTGFLLVKSQQDFYLSSISWVVMGSVAVVLGLYRAQSKFKVQLNYKLASIRQTVRYWKTSIHFTLSNGISALYEAMPVFILFIFTDPVSVGLYSAPYRLIIAAFFLVSIYPMTIFPVLSNLFTSNPAKFKQVTNFSAMGILMLTMTVSLISWIHAREIVIVLFSEMYNESIPTFKILLLFFVFRSVRAVYVRAICAGDGEKIYSKIALSGLSMLLLLVFILYFTDQLVLTNLAGSLVITELVILLLLVLGVRKISRRISAVKHH